MLGDGTVYYTLSALWTAAQHKIPVVFVARNSEYATLKGLSRLMHAPDVPGLELPGMDIPGIATAYGIESARVNSLSDLTRAVNQTLGSDQPRLIQVTERRFAEVVHVSHLMPAQNVPHPNLGSIVTPAELYEWVRKHAPSNLEGVFIAGNGFRSIGVIAALKEDLGRPVLTAD
jgi:Thiamine pyrophosphate enzyme, C-terminal TPP binding domain